VLKFPPARKFPTELKKMKYEIEVYARDFGLDFFPVIFEVLDYKDLNEVAAYGGFPRRYPHWYFGMQFEGLSKSYAYGLSKIYEMVINNDPCYAYLLKCNNLVDQKLVMAHVYAHCDFFRNNLYFAHTNRKMVDEMANHATRIQRYVDRYGAETLEAFIDCCFSLENLIDPHRPFMKRQNEEGPMGAKTLPSTLFPNPERGSREEARVGFPLSPSRRVNPKTPTRRVGRRKKRIKAPTPSPAQTMSASIRGASAVKVIWTPTSIPPIFSKPGRRR
jgi:stage V sporulation protein R